MNTVIDLLYHERLILTLPDGREVVVMAGRKSHKLCQVKLCVEADRDIPVTRPEARRKS